MTEAAPLARRGAMALLTVAVCAGAATAQAATERYAGETETGEAVKLVANGRGEVIRGAITSITDCSGRFEDFRARIEFGRPLDRSDRGRFRDEGAVLDEDDRFSARYKYEVKGERESERAFSGSLTLKITFRRDDEEYTTCRVRDLVFGAERRK